MLKILYCIAQVKREESNYETAVEIKWAFRTKFET